MKTTFVLAILVCVGLTVSAQKNDFLCDTCVGIVKVVQDYVRKEIPLEEVEKEVKELCQVLPGDLKKLCEDKLIPAIDQMYNQVEDTPPRDLCVELEFCN